MDVPENSSTLAINNCFYKVSKTITDKKAKNESTAKEVEWIQSQLLNENPKFCENAVNVLISTCDVGFSLNCIVSTLPRISNRTYEIVADGMIRLLLIDLEKPGYKCHFGIQQKAHPMLLLIDESSNKMLYLSQRIVSIINHRNDNIRCNAIEFLYPVLLILFTNEKIYSESRQVWKSLLDKEEMVKKVLSLRRASTISASSLFNSMILMLLEQSKEKIHCVLLLLVLTKHLISLSMDPSENFQVLLDHADTIANHLDSANIVLFLLAEILQITSITHIPKLMELLEVLIVKRKLGHTIILNMVLDGNIQILAYPSFASRNLTSASRLLNYIQTNKCSSTTSTIHFRSNFMNLSPELTNARDVVLLLETQQNPRFKEIMTEAERFFWTRNQLVLRGFFHSLTEEMDNWSVVLSNLIYISKDNEVLKSSLVMPLLFKLTTVENPRMKLAILRNIINLGASSEVFNIIKALSSGLIRSMSIDLHLRLWKVEPRTYPFLHKVLVEKSSKDSEDLGLEIVRAAAIKEICDLRPQHGSDLISIISEILNGSTDSDSDISTALAVDSIVLLCQNHVINVVSTWKAISLTTRYEKRPRVVSSLCKFFSIVPSMKRTSLEYENLMKEIQGRLWHMVQWSDKHGIESALESMKSWNNDALTLDTIPEAFREGIALPEAPTGMEVSILDLEVPGECFVQLLTKVSMDCRQAAGKLLAHYIGCEINEFRSGHYLVKEGQPEPLNYKNLHKQSILKALVSFVIKQANTRKADKLVDENLLLESLKVLSHGYSRPLPPLDWCFMHDLLHKSDEIKFQCMCIAAKQAVISGTAKRLIENFLVNLDGNSDDETYAALEILVDLCNGISPEVMKVFCEFIFKKQKEISAKMVKKCLIKEKFVTNRDNLGLMLKIYTNSIDSIPLDLVRLIPPNILDFLTFQLTPRQKIEFRCEIVKNVKVENPIGWISELVNEQQIPEVFFESFAHMLIDSDVFPKKKWLNDFIVMIQNRLVEHEIEEVKIEFLLNVFVISVVVTSGYYKVFSTQDEFLTQCREAFSQSIQLVSQQSAYDDLAGNIFEFLLHIITFDKISAETCDAFKSAIVVSKDHSYFKRAKVWQRFLMIR